ncbi:MAG: hypothetical protein WC735_02555 [Candidatus Paceibacterota bacterium]|jgi:hypothetical protein
MKILTTSINLSIISLSVAVFYYFLNFLPVFYSLPIGSFIYVNYAFALIESIIAAIALIMGIKENNKAGIILSLLLLITFLKPFFYYIFVFLSNFN